MNENLDKTERELNSRISELKEILTSKQETQSATIDTAVQEFQEWKVRLKDQYEDYYHQIDEQLKLLAETNEQKISELQTDFSSAAKRAGDILSGFDNDSRKRIEEFDTMYNEMLTNVKAYNEEQIKNAELKIKDLKKSFTEKANEYKSAYQGATDRLNEETNNLQKKVDDIKKSIAEFVSESSAFERADILKRQLDGNIEDLSEKIASVKAYDVKLNELANQIRQLDRLGDDVNSKLNAYSADQSRIDSIEYKFNNLLELSNGIDAKLLEVQKINDEFINMQMTMHKYNESMGNMESKFDRIEKKSETVDRVAEAVDNSFKNINSLEKRLDEYSGKFKDLPGEMEKIKKNMDSIIKNGERINEAVDKISSLQSIIKEVESQMDGIENSKKGFTATEERLQKLYNDTENQINLLHSISMKDTGKKKSSSSSSGISPQTRASVISLKKRGWDNSEIARSLKIEENLVSVILELGTDE